MRTEVLEALRRAGAEIVKESFNDQACEALLRVKDEAAWLPTVKRLLEAESSSPDWTAHVCKRFLVKEVEGQNALGFLWNLMLRVRAPEQWAEVLQVLSGRAPRTSSEEIQMLGLPKNADRGKPNAKGKGVYTPMSFPGPGGG